MSTPRNFPTLSRQAEEFLDSVLRLRPRIAVFDCDGTLWQADSGAQFFYWELEHGLLPEEVAKWARARYEEYLAGRVGEEQMCGEMVTINRGIACQHLDRAAEACFERRVAPGIFPEMLELALRLGESGSQLWAVSSTADWVVRPGAARFGIPAERVIGACAEIEDGRCTDRLIRVPTDELKATAIHELLPRTPDAVFGNSVHDVAMMELGQHAFAITPTEELEQAARQHGWRIYRPFKIEQAE